MKLVLIESFPSVFCIKLIMSQIKIGTFKSYPRHFHPKNHFLLDFLKHFPFLHSFIGGAAEKLSNVKAGDEILEINGVSTEKQSRIDVWNMIKKLPQGENVQMKIKRK